jgi:hypothetical protein
MFIVLWCILSRQQPRWTRHRNQQNSSRADSCSRLIQIRVKQCFRDRLRFHHQQKPDDVDGNEVGSWNTGLSESKWSGCQPDRILLNLVAWSIKTYVTKLLFLKRQSQLSWNEGKFMFFISSIFCSAANWTVDSCLLGYDAFYLGK